MEFHSSVPEPPKPLQIPKRPKIKNQRATWSFFSHLFKVRAALPESGKDLKRFKIALASSNNSFFSTGLSPHPVLKEQGQTVSMRPSVAWRRLSTEQGAACVPSTSNRVSTSQVEKSSRTGA